MPTSLHYSYPCSIFNKYTIIHYQRHLDQRKLVCQVFFYSPISFISLCFFPTWSCQTWNFLYWNCNKNPQLAKLVDILFKQASVANPFNVNLKIRNLGKLLSTSDILNFAKHLSSMENNFKWESSSDNYHQPPISWCPGIWDICPGE